MEKFYGTFGYGHLHLFNGITLDHDIVGVIEAPDMEKAWEVAFNLFGDKFFTVYNEASIEMKYFPRGTINLN